MIPPSICLIQFCHVIEMAFIVSASYLMMLHCRSWQHNCHNNFWKYPNMFYVVENRLVLRKSKKSMAVSIYHFSVAYKSEEFFLKIKHNDYKTNMYQRSKIEWYSNFLKY